MSSSDALPPLSSSDHRLFDLFVSRGVRLDLHALAESTGRDLADLTAWAAAEHIQLWCRAYLEVSGLRILALRTEALSALSQTLDNPNLVEKRRAATALLRALATRNTLGGTTLRGVRGDSHASEWRATPSSPTTAGGGGVRAAGGGGSVSTRSTHAPTEAAPPGRAATSATSPPSTTPSFRAQGRKPSENPSPPASPPTSRIQHQPSDGSRRPALKGPARIPSPLTAPVPISSNSPPDLPSATCHLQFSPPPLWPSGPLPFGPLATPSRLLAAAGLTGPAP